MNKDDFEEGEYIVYVNGEKYELGRIKTLREDGAFVAYHHIIVEKREQKHRMI